MKAKNIKANLLCDISHLISDKSQLITLNATADKQLLFSVQHRLKYPGQLLPNHRIFLVENNLPQEITQIEKPVAIFHHLGLLPQNKILCVYARARPREHKDFYNNGFIYSLSGEKQGEIYLSDAIEGLQTTKAEHIWTSYFDEGIFGECPDSHSGLAKWDMAGNNLYQFTPNHGLDHMACCYALNVETDHTTWCYYYADFPLVKVTNDQIENYWDIPIKGSQSFIMSDNLAVFRGGYEDQDSFYLIKLSDQNPATIKQKFTLTNLDKIDHITARQDIFHILSDHKIYRLTMEDFCQPNHP